MQRERPDVVILYPMQNNCNFNATELREELWASLARRVYSSPDGINCLTADETVFFSVRLFQAERNNGGIDQFFFNSSGDYFKEVIAGLKTLGAHQTCGLLMIATLILFARKSPPPDRADRSHVLLTPRAERCADALDTLEAAMDDSKNNLSAKLNALGLCT